MAIDKKELQSRLWTEWTNGLKILADSLMKDQVDIINSACTAVLGNENFIQKAVMYVQRKTYIGKFKDYKSRIAAYEKSIVELIDEVNRAAPVETSKWIFCRLEVKRPEWKIEYKSTLGEIIIDGDDSFENADWGDHAIEAYEKLSDYVNHMMDILLQTNLATGAVGGAAVCAIDLVECLVMVAAGKMTWQELETRTGKNIFQTGAGVVGATIGATLGAVGGPLGATAGAIIGGMITSVAATVAIENHIEKPFREIMDNARSLAQAETLMSNAMNYLEGATVAMEDFKKGLFLSQVDFEKGMASLRQKRTANWNLIHNLK